MDKILYFEYLIKIKCIQKNYNSTLTNFLYHLSLMEI